MVPFVDLPAQYREIQEEIETDVLWCMRSCVFVGGFVLERFERTLSNYLAVDHIVGVSNGTDAIMLACEALGIGKGHQVIIPNNSFIASAYGVSRAGAKPLLVDVDPYTYLLDINIVEDLLKDKKRKIKAVMVVDLYGQQPNMEAFRELCDKYGVYLLEDAAQSIGSTYKKLNVGKLADVATTSFYPAKNLGTIGQGGAVITNKLDIAKKVRIIANQGSEAKYEHVCLGGNYRLDTIKAAQLYHALRKLDSWNDARRRIAQAYNDNFSAEQRPMQVPCGRHIYHLYELCCKDSDERARLMKEFENNRISYGLHYPKLISELPMYKNMALPTPVAEQLRDRLISLPIFPTMDEYQAARVIDCVHRVCGKEL